MFGSFFVKTKLTEPENRWAGQDALVFDKLPTALTVEDLSQIAELAQRKGCAKLIFKFDWRRWNKVATKEFNHRERQFEITLTALLKGLGIPVQATMSDGPGWGPPPGREYVSIFPST